MAIQSAFFPTDGSTRTFTSTKHIATKQNLAVWRRLVSDQSWELAPIASYDLINNGAVFAIAPSSTLYSEIEVRVADNPDELVQSPSDVTIVAGIENEIVTVAGIENEVVTVAGIENEVVTVAGDTIPINTVAGDTIPINQTAQDSVVINTVAGDTLAINDLASDPMRSAILDVSSEPVRQAVLDAEGNANDAQLEAWISEAEAMTSESNAKEAEDVFTKTYTSNGDGTFTSVNNAWYSSLHYSLKAQQEATTIPSKTSARNSVISAVNGVNALATTPTPSHIDVTYIGNGTSLNLKTGEADGVEQIVNGGGSDTTGWTTVTSTLTTDGSVFTLTIAGSAGGMKQTLSGLTIGGQYDVEFTVDSVSDASGLHIGTTDNGFDVVNQAIIVGKNRVTIHPTTSTIYFKIVEQNASNAVTMVLHDITTKEVTGGLPSVSRPWVASASYTIGDYQTHDYIIYEALTTHTGVATTPDADATNWVAIADGVHLDADNSDIWIKSRSLAYNNYRFDTMRGDRLELYTNATTAEIDNTANHTIDFTINGFTVTTVGGVDRLNTNLATFVAWVEYFDKMFSFTTNHGKRGICAYNAQSGKFMVSYQGSGTAGHDIPHGVGTKPDFFVAKDRGVIGNWPTYDTPSTALYYKFLNTNGANTNASSEVVWNNTEPNESVVVLGSGVVNALNSNLIAYGSSNRKNHSYIGSYAGTGVAGNPVDVGMDLLALDTAGKNIKVMIKALSTTGRWNLHDTARSGSPLLNDALFAEDSIAEQVNDASRSLTLNSSGFVLNTTFSEYNGSGVQYLIEVTVEDFDNPNGGLDLSPSKTSYADGSNATGDADVTATTIAPATYPQIVGTKNYFYTDFVDADTVTLGSTDVKLLEGLNRVDADKWGVESPSDATLKTTDKHSGYGSATGVVSVSSENTASYLGYYAFTKNVSTINDSWATLGVTGKIRYTFTEQRKLKSYRFRTGYISATDANNISARPTDWTIKGISIDGSETTIDTVVSYVCLGATGEWEALIEVVDENPYIAIEMDISGNNGNVSATTIGELELNTEHPSGDFYNVAEGITYDSADTAIKRVYTAEASVDGSNEIIPDTWVDRAIKNQNLTDVTVHGDAEFLGGFDLGQSLVDVENDRFLDVVYTNKTGKTKHVLVTLANTATNSGSFFEVNGARVARGYSTANSERIIYSVPVDSGSTYEITLSNGTQTIEHWFEY